MSEVFDLLPLVNQPDRRQYSRDERNQYKLERVIGELEFIDDAIFRRIAPDEIEPLDLARAKLIDERIRLEKALGIYEAPRGFSDMDTPMFWPEDN